MPDHASSLSVYDRIVNDDVTRLYIVASSLSLTPIAVYASCLQEAVIRRSLAPIDAFKLWTERN